MREPTTLIPDVSASTLSFHGAGLTHAGRVRSINEDSILTDPSGVFWSIADGMGGHGHGDTASEIVIDHLSEIPDEGEPKAQVDALLNAANQAIQRYATEIGAERVGATVVAVKLVQWYAHVSWVGDCRAYLFRNESLRQLTRDHTVVEELVREGLLDPENARDHASANVVTRAVGAEETLDIDHLTVPIVAGDRLLLCSDGLTACMPDDDIQAILGKAADPDAACRFLVAAALDAGAPDNVSVIVIFAEEK